MKTNFPPQPPRELGRRDRLQVDLVWSWHYRTLVALRDRLVEAEVDRLREKGRPAASAWSRTARLPDEPAQEFTLALLTQDPAALGGISAAIERILNGSYGICEATGAMIPAERLRATPWIRCAADPGAGGDKIRRKFAHRCEARIRRSG